MRVTTIVLQIQTAPHHDIDSWPEHYAKDAAEMLYQHIRTRCDIPADEFQVTYAGLGTNSRIGELVYSELDEE